MSTPISDILKKNNISQFIPEPEKLALELEELDITEEDRQQITKLYDSWSTCLSQRITIQNLAGHTVFIGQILKIDNEILPNIITLKSTLYFQNCSNLKIKFDKKVNHITIENCVNIDLFIPSGSISGIDTLNSSKINVCAVDNNVYYLDIGKSKECQYWLDESIALNTLISSLNCFNIKFLTTTSKDTDVDIDKTKDKTNCKRFQTNMSIFGSNIWYEFAKVDSKLLMKYISTDTATNTIGEIYPQ
jgi:hypothetical protein